MKTIFTLKNYQVSIIMITLSMFVGFFSSQLYMSLRAFSPRLEQGTETLVRTETSGGAEVPLETFTEREATTFEPEFLFPIAQSDFLQYTSPFGHRISPILGYEMSHQGLDIHAIWRAEVIAVADGVIEEHWPPPDNYWKGHSTYGGMILIRHNNGTRTLYAHLNSTRITTGDRVSAGEPIGRVGGTGLSRGEHLHFEVIIDEKKVNPLLYIPNL